MRKRLLRMIEKIAPRLFLVTVACIGAFAGNHIREVSCTGLGRTHAGGLDIVPQPGLFCNWATFSFYLSMYALCCFAFRDLSRDEKEWVTDLQKAVGIIFYYFCIVLFRYWCIFFYSAYFLFFMPIIHIGVAWYFLAVGALFLLLSLLLPRLLDRKR